MLSLKVITLTGPEKCCDIPVIDNIPYQCQSVISTSYKDPIYSKTGQTCIEFRRAMTAELNFNCKISPQISVSSIFYFNCPKCDLRC